MADRAPVLNHHLGADRGRETRVKRANKWARSIYAGALTLDRSVKIADLTNDEIAAHLKRPPFNLHAPKGGELTGKNIHKAFARMGVDRSEIKKLRAKAAKAAERFGLDDTTLLVYQLWHEWQRHQAERVFVHGLEVGSESRPFVFSPVHPDDWVAPWVRDPQPMLSLMGPPPWAKLAQALMGLLDPAGEDRAVEDEKARGEAERRAAAEAAGEEYAGHFDDAVDFGDYLRSVGAVRDA